MYVPEPKIADGDEQNARHQRRGEKARIAVGFNDLGDEHDEGTFAGPPIWKRLPPKAEMRKPPTIAA